MSIAYISGHLKLSEQEFAEHYEPKIQEAAKRGDSFIVCDARGADTMAQKYLYEIGVENVTVYHMFDKPRNNKYHFPTKGGFKSDEDRDKAATYASDYDIAWVRPGREESGTAKNLYRRKEKDKGRTSTYWDMSPQEQWDEDKRLGILDWDGN